MKNSKRVLIVTIFTFYVLGFFMLFNNRVNAEELSQFCEYTEPCISTELIDSWYETNNLDRTIYDSYLIVVFQEQSSSGIRNYITILFYNNEQLDNKEIYISKTNYYYYINFNYNVKRYEFHGNKLSPTKFSLTSSSINYNYTDGKQKIGINADSKINIVTYISNKDIKDEDGNILLARNDIEEQPEEEPITIINKMALFVNDIIVYFNENNISFYQILIGLFIFNFLVYIICYIIRRF